MAAKSAIRRMQMRTIMKDLPFGTRDFGRSAAGWDEWVSDSRVCSTHCAFRGQYQHMDLNLQYTGVIMR